MKYLVMSDSADDLMFESHDIRVARKGIDSMRAEYGTYFSVSIQKHAPRSPYFRKLLVVETHQLDGSVDKTQYFVRENGETPR